MTRTAEGKRRPRGVNPHERIALADPCAHSFVEFESAADLRTAVEKLDGRDFKGKSVTCVADVSLRCHGKDDCVPNLTRPSPKPRLAIPGDVRDPLVDADRILLP